MYFNYNQRLNRLSVPLVSLSETYPLKYWWCSPPIASVRPTEVARAKGEIGETRRRKPSQ
jgi:hypothetical protein